MVSRFLYPRAGSVPAGSFIGFIVLSLLGVPLWVSAGFLLLLSGLLISVDVSCGHRTYAAGADTPQGQELVDKNGLMCRVTSER